MFNEQQTIRDVLQSVCKNYKVVVVDDGSTDLSGKIVKEFPVFYLRHQVNLGQGAALQTGITFSLLQGAEYIVTFDADGQHSASDIDGLLTTLRKDAADIVFGSRFLPGSYSNISAGRKIAVQIARWLNFLFTGLLLSDAHNGLRAMNRKAAASIHLKEGGMAHASEILFQVKKNRLRFSEQAVAILYTDYSKSKGQQTSNGLRIFYNLILNKLFK